MHYRNRHCYVLCMIVLVPSALSTTIQHIISKYHGVLFILLRISVFLMLDEVAGMAGLENGPRPLNDHTTFGHKNHDKV